MKIRWQRILALLIIFIYLVVAFAAPLISPAENTQAPSPYKRVGSISDRVPHPPNATSILGTVPTQFDVFHTLIWGAREELKFGVLVTLIAAILGTLLGAVSGYQGGVFNRLAMRITDGFLTFPVIAAVVFITMIYGIVNSVLSPNLFFMQPGAVGAAVYTQKATPIFDFILWLFEVIKPFPLAIILFSWMPYTRMINDQVIKLKQTEFVEAAVSVGARKSRVIFKHLIPNAISSNVVLAARDVGGMVILRATFTYIGLADGSPWANMLVLGRNFVIGPGGSPGAYWWVYLPITFAIIFFGLGWNLLGDELNEWLNPRLR